MTDERIIAYLLKELPEHEREQFEDDCFAQESWPPQINLAEEDLIDAYLRDELPPERRQRFERNYLTTEARQERVIIAAALLRHMDESYAASGKLARVLRAAAAIAAVAVIAVVVWRSIVPEPSPTTFATLTLTISNSTRAEGTQSSKVKLPPDTRALKVSLMLPEQQPPSMDYRIVLERSNGETSPVEVAGKDAQSVQAIIPSAQLPQGRYALKLFAIQTDGTEQRITDSYYFTVE